MIIAEKLLFLGIAIIIIGIILLVIASLWLATKQSTESNIKTEIAIGGFIGPIPFGFFSSKKAFWIWLGLTVVVAIFLVIWFLLRK